MCAQFQKLQKETEKKKKFLLQDKDKQPVNHSKIQKHAISKTTPTTSNTYVQAQQFICC